MSSAEFVYVLETTIGYGLVEVVACLLSEEYVTKVVIIIKGRNRDQKDIVLMALLRLLTTSESDLGGCFQEMQGEP